MPLLVVGHVPTPCDGAAVSSLCCVAIWAMKRLAAAPCQWSRRAQEDAVARADDLDRAAFAPAEAEALGDEDRLAVGWVCQAVWAPGVKCTSAAAKAEVPAGTATASM